MTAGLVIQVIPKFVSTFFSFNTYYMVLLYSSVVLPGEWKAGKYFQPARQQLFRNKDSVSVSLFVGPASKFEFSKEGLRGFAFAMAYY